MKIGIAMGTLALRKAAMRLVPKNLGFRVAVMNRKKLNEIRTGKFFAWLSKNRKKPSLSKFKAFQEDDSPGLNFGKAPTGDKLVVKKPPKAPKK